MAHATNNMAPTPIFNTLSIAPGFGGRNSACSDVLAVIYYYYILLTASLLATPACRGVAVNNEWHYLQISSRLVIPSSNMTIDEALGQ